MAGERELDGRREDPDAHVGVVVRRREDEHRFGQVRLLRERLHRQLVEVARVGEHGELVAGERHVGEDVADDVAEAAHGRDLDDGGRLPAAPFGAPRRNR